MAGPFTFGESERIPMTARPKPGEYFFLFLELPLYIPLASFLSVHIAMVGTVARHELP